MSSKSSRSSRRCYACHGALQQKAGLRLDTAQAHVAREGTMDRPSHRVPAETACLLSASQRLALAGCRRSPRGNRSNPNSWFSSSAGSTRGQPLPRTSSRSPTRGGTGHFIHRRARQCRHCKMAGTLATPWMLFSTPNGKSAASCLNRRRTSASCCGGFTLTSSVCRRPGRNWTPSRRTPLRMLTRSWSITCWPANNTVSLGTPLDGYLAL